MIHFPSAFLFDDSRIKVLVKYGGELVIVGFLGYRCTSARNEVGTLSGNNVEPVLQVRAAVSSARNKQAVCRGPVCSVSST